MRNRRKRRKRHRQNRDHRNWPNFRQEQNGQCAITVTSTKDGCLLEKNASASIGLIRMPMTACPDKASRTASLRELCLAEHGVASPGRPLGGHVRLAKGLQAVPPRWRDRGGRHEARASGRCLASPTARSLRLRARPVVQLSRIPSRGGCGRDAGLAERRENPCGRAGCGKGSGRGAIAWR